MKCLPQPRRSRESKTQAAPQSPMASPLSRPASRSDTTIFRHERTVCVVEREASVQTDTQRSESREHLAASALGTATLHEASGRHGALPSAIKAVAPDMRLCGSAVTVSCPPGDNLRLHHAIYLAQPGDVLVVAVGDGAEYGYWGEIMTVAAQARHLGGLVIDGGVRDSARLAALGFPIFSRGVCIRGTDKNPAVGSINRSILLGDVTVQPGDLVVGDLDGVVVVAGDRITEVVDASARREADEANLMQRLRDGERTIDIFSWPTSDLG